MTLKTSKRGEVAPFIVMDVLRAANERAARGESVLHLEVGQPATGAPAAVIEAAKSALDGDRIGYTEAFGISSLRDRIARHYADYYGTSVDAERIVVTTGSSGAFLLAFLSAFDVGDRVALAAPGYPAYRNILSALGLVPVEIPTGPETRFQPTPALIDALDAPIDGLIVASPANPTGTMMTPEELSRLARYCDDQGIRLISDEIYHGITFGGRAATALASSGHAFVVNSFSKYFCMTGWRLGWMVVPEDLLRPIECLAQNLYISPPTLSQHAAVVAFDCAAELDGHVARYARNRDVLLDRLPAAGLENLAPVEGAFYIYADVSRISNDSEDLCRRVLAETGVAMTPGTDFDTLRGHRFVRISFAGTTEDMTVAADRLAGWRR
ncbi:MAG: pyridoxal phosphate-dependent aminotransferase [Proteobacteria bacterium]|nr:pyridoxal phosphate-dependent aminotransferase [Pseudomonadota bacterium]